MFILIAAAIGVIAGLAIWDHNHQNSEKASSNVFTRPWLVNSNISPAQVFLIAAPAALLSVGINLDLNGHSFVNYAIKDKAQLAQVRSALSSATGEPVPPSGISGLKPAPDDVTNILFIREKGGLNGDDAAFIISPQSDGSYQLKVVSLNAQGNMTAPLRPSDSFKPVFIRPDGGYQSIILNPDIDFSGTGTLASAANSSQLSINDRVAALHLAAAGDHVGTPAN